MTSFQTVNMFPKTDLINEVNSFAMFRETNNSMENTQPYGLRSENTQYDGLRSEYMLTAEEVRCLSKENEPKIEAKLFSDLVFTLNARIIKTASEKKQHFIILHAQTYDPVVFPKIVTYYQDSKGYQCRWTKVVQNSRLVPITDIVISWDSTPLSIPEDTLTKGQMMKKQSLKRSLKQSLMTSNQRNFRKKRKIVIHHDILHQKKTKISFE